MPDINTVLEANHAAVADFLTTAEHASETWTVPRAAGKWSPSQVLEHVARALEESAKVVSGAPSQFPTLPAVLRPIARGLFFNRILRNKAFPKARTNKSLDPSRGPATPAEGRLRLEGALADFERECRACAAGSETVSSTIFGRVRLTEYIRFQELHIRHHRSQLLSHESAAVSRLTSA